MKRIELFIAAVVILILGISLSSRAQVIVKVRPVPPAAVIVRPVCPGPNHVWIDSYWRWNPRVRRYEWLNGYWMLPRRGMVWVQGHWADVPGRGFKWIPGHWRRR